MANDSKLGLLAGLAAVVVIAVVYFQKPPEAGAAAPPRPATVGMTPAVIVTIPSR